MRMAMRLTMTVLGAVLLAVPALAGDVAGRWAAEFDTQVGPQKYTFDLKVEGDKLTGTAHFERMGQTGEAELIRGKVDGDTVTFVEMLDFQGNQVEIAYSGKVEGDEIAFTRDVGGFASESFKARRVVD